MTFTSLEAVFVTAAFLVPGFIWSAVVAMMMPVRTVPAQVRLVELLTFSVVNYGLWFWVPLLIYTSAWHETHPYWSALALFGIIVVSPVVLGAATGYFHQKRFIARFLGWLGLRTVHPIPRAWDWHFSQAEPYWVVVTLKNGSHVYGLFHERSFAASDYEHRDLYLEEQFRVLDNGEWAPVDETGGVLIMADQIAIIEFRKFSEVNHGA